MLGYSIYFRIDLISAPLLVITLEPGSVYKLMRVKSGTSVTVTDDEYHKSKHYAPTLIPLDQIMMATPVIGTDNLDDDEKQEVRY